jgi:hypothetical protein
VIVENIEGEPAKPIVVGPDKESPPAPPEPTVTGYVAVETVIPVGVDKGEAV